MKKNLLSKIPKISGLMILLAILLAGLQSAIAGDYRYGHKKSYYYSPTIADLVEKTNGFDFLEAALGLAGLTGALDGHKSFTLFAPTNDAFQALADACPAVNGDVVALAVALNDAGLLDDVLLYHVAKYPRSLETLLKRGSVKTLSEIGADLKTGVDNGGTFVMGEINSGPSNIVVEGLKVRNGIVYPINSVLLNVDPTGLCGISDS